jgi:hypothetical protein
MSSVPLTWRTRVAGIVLVLAFAATALYTGAPAPVIASRPAHGKAVLTSLRCCFERPVLAVEFPQDARDLEYLLSKTDVREAYARSINRDFAFIAAYVLLWCFVASRFRRGPILVATALLLVLGGVADVFENRGVLQAIELEGDRTGQLTDALASDIGWWAAAKWALLGAAFVLIAAVAWPRRTVTSGWQVMRIAIALAYGFAGIVCLGAIWFEAPWLLERTALPIAITVLLELVLFAIGDVHEPAPDPTPTALRV